MTADERIETLERNLAETRRELAAAGQRSRRRTLAALAIAAALAIGWLVTESSRPAYAQDAEKPQAAEKPQGVIRARGFVLVDDKGRERGKLEMKGSAPWLILSDEKGKPRAMLLAFTDGASLMLSDEKGPRAMLNAIPSLSLYDEKVATRAELKASADGPSLRLSDEKGKTRAMLSAFTDGPSLRLSDEKGQGRATIGSTVTGTPDGRKTTHPESSILLFGPDGKGIWKAPR